MCAEAVRCCRAALAAGARLGGRDRPGGLGAVHLWKSPALDCATLSPRDRPRIGSMPVSDRVCFSCADGDTICARSPAARHDGGRVGGGSQGRRGAACRRACPASLLGEGTRHRPEARSAHVEQHRRDVAQWHAREDMWIAQQLAEQARADPSASDRVAVKKEGKLLIIPASRNNVANVWQPQTLQISATDLAARVLALFRERGRTVTWKVAIGALSASLGTVQEGAVRRAVTAARAQWRAEAATSNKQQSRLQRATSKRLRDEATPVD